MERNHNQPRLFSAESIPFRVEYEVLDAPGLRERYVHLTDKLIHKVENQQTEALIFLDKSARPVAWMFREFWPLVHGAEPMPAIYFLNIDREQWRPYVGSDETGKINVDDLPDSQMGDLRSIFTNKTIPDGDSAFDYKTKLDDKKVLVVDEVKVSGDTLDIARDMLKRAVPSAEIEGAWWMIPEIRAKPGQPAMNQELPVWYSDTTNTGRGVGNRDYSKSQNSASRRQRRGGLFLSTPLRNHDPSSRQLRNEIKQIAQDIRERKLAYMPDYSRGDLDRLFEKVNGYSLDEYLVERQKTKI